jgi:hypothetical protein
MNNTISEKFEILNNIVMNIHKFSQCGVFETAISEIAPRLIEDFKSFAKETSFPISWKDFLLCNFKIKSETIPFVLKLNRDEFIVFCLSWLKKGYILNKEEYYKFIYENNSFLDVSSLTSKKGKKVFVHFSSQNLMDVFISFYGEDTNYDFSVQSID